MTPHLDKYIACSKGRVVIKPNLELHNYLFSIILYSQTQHTFKRVLDENIGQKEVFDGIGFPLVKDLLQGKNGTLHET